jgi:hypothetical protein
MTETTKSPNEAETEAPTVDLAEHEELKSVIDEAKEKFSSPSSLIDAIKNRSMRVVKLDLGFDEVNSEKLAGIEGAIGQLRVILDRGERNAGAADEYRRVAVEIQEQIADPESNLDVEELKADLAQAEREVEQREALAKELVPLLAKADELEAAAQEVRDAVRKESLSVELRAIPYSIARGSARRARKALDITQKGIPAELQDEFEERQLLELAYDQVQRWRDNRTGEEGTKLEMEVLEALRDFMPTSQSAKFFSTVNDLQFKNAISESAIAQADF